jgi:hypothetical protein
LPRSVAARHLPRVSQARDDAGWTAVLEPDVEGEGEQQDDLDALVDVGEAEPRPEEQPAGDRREGEPGEAEPHEPPPGREPARQQEAGRERRIADRVEREQQPAERGVDDRRRQRQPDDAGVQDREARIRRAPGPWSKRVHVPPRVG